MDIQTEITEESVVLRLKGELVMAEGEALKRALVELASRDRARVVMDLAELSFIDSSGLGILLWAMKNMRQRGGDVRLFGLTKMVKEVFEITELRQAFKVFETEKQALASFAATQE